MFDVTIYDRGSSSERRRLLGGPCGRGLPVSPRRRKPTGHPCVPKLTLVPVGSEQRGSNSGRSFLRPRRPFLASSVQTRDRV